MSLIAIKQGDSTSKRCDQLINELQSSRKVSVTHRDGSVQKLIAVIEIVKSKLADDQVKVYQYNRLSDRVASDKSKRPLEEGDNTESQDKLKKREVELTVILSLDQLQIEDEWTEQ
jgi:hypothetical protein